MIRELDEKRLVFTRRLFDRVEEAGRPLRCAVAGCPHAGRDELEIHHIVPARIRPWHREDNLATLCPDHHALVERYYWQALSQKAPDLTREIRQIARMFKQRAVPFKRINHQRARTQALWDQLNALTDHPEFWRKAYAEALKWAESQVITREVAPKAAITELMPWWRAA